MEQDIVSDIYKFYRGMCIAGVQGPVEVRLSPGDHRELKLALLRHDWLSRDNTTPMPRLSNVEGAEFTIYGITFKVRR